jgi:hypothetical protein
MLIQLNNSQQNIINQQKEELSLYKNNKKSVLDLNKELLYIFETNNAEIKTILYHYLDKIDLNVNTHIKNNNDNKLLEQSKHIDKLEKELKTQEQIITHLRNKDLDKIVADYSEL